MHYLKVRLSMSLFFNRGGSSLCPNRYGHLRQLHPLRSLAGICGRISAILSEQLYRQIPVLESVLSPLRKLEPPLLKIAQFVLFAVWLIALITYPLLSTLRKIDRQSNTKKNDDKKEYERDDDETKLYEMDIPPVNTESEFFARIILVAVFLYIVSPTPLSPRIILVRMPSH